MEEIHSSKCTSNDWVHRVTDTGEAHLRVPSDVGEDVPLTQLDKGQLAVVAVGEVVW